MAKDLSLRTRLFRPALCWARFTTLICLLLQAGLAVVWAAPFAKQISFRQPDGTLIQLWGQGDEFYAVFETLDGYTVVFDPSTKAYYYAQLSTDGSQLLATRLQVGAGAPDTLGLAPHLRISAAAIKQQVTPKQAAWDNAMQVSTRWNALKAAQRNQPSTDDVTFSPPRNTTTGLKVGLTLLIDFTDDPQTVPQADIVGFCNGDNYTGYGNNGSVKKYFADNSNGVLTYTNVVTIYITAPKPKSFYNDVTKDAGAQANILIKDVLDTMKALPTYSTDILPLFDALTVDSANRVVAFNVFYAGDNGGVWTYGLWPHSWSLMDVGAQELSPGGKVVYRYQISNIGNQLELSTFCHENGHMLCGYPDIYDYDYDSVGGAGNFCLMDYSGTSAQNPSQICAYLKRASGWATTTDLTSADNIMANVSDLLATNFNHFYRYAKPGVPTEYYLIECRAQTGRDAQLPSSGVAVWHIDELGDHDNQSLVPNTTHANYEVTLVQADNLWHFERNKNAGDTNDLFYQGNQASGYINRVDDSSGPSSRWWDGTKSGLVLRAFSAPGPVMTFIVGTNQITPSINSLTPANQTVLAGRSASFTVSVSGQPPFSYQWLRNGTNITALNSNILTLASTVASDSGGYSVVVTNLYGGATSAVVTLTVVPTVPLPTALNTAGWSWTTDPILSWYGSTNISHDASAAARSYFIQDGQQSTLSTTVSGPGTLSFWWKVSSQANLDVLTFQSVGGQMTNTATISGDVDWSPMTVYLPAGTTACTWTYSKDAAGSAGLDAGFVDQVSFTTTPTLPFVFRNPASLTAAADTPAVFSVAAGGTPPLSYQWRFNGADIPGATATSYTILSPGPTDAGSYSVRVSNPYGSTNSLDAVLSVVPLVVNGDNSLGQSDLSAISTNAVMVAAGSWHTLVLTGDGRILARGDNYNGQCNAPTNLVDVVQIAAGGYHSLALQANGTVTCWGANYNGQATPPAGLKNVVAISAGTWHSLALKADGSVVAWGDNSFGQRNLPAGLKGVIAIAAGGNHNLALLSNRTLVAWGENTDSLGGYSGQSTVPWGLSAVKAVSAGEYHSLAVKVDGTVVAWGDNSEGQCQVPAGLSNVIAVAGGGAHSLALKSDGTVAGWGNNWNGQASFSTNVINVSTIAAGNAHSVLLIGLSQPRLLSAALTGNHQFSTLVPSYPGRSYVLQYKASLNSATWKAASTNAGTGAPLFLSDPTPTDPSRFYRLLIW